MISGTGTLLRLSLRRDRVVVSVCVLALGGLAAGSASATVELYPTASSRAAAAAAANASPALVALYGEVGSSMGALASFKMTGTMAVFLALLAMFVVRRHTRTEEETGRAELVLAGAVSRHAPLTAALLEASLAVAAAAALAVLGFIGSGLPVVGSVALGVSWLIVGGCFAGVTAVAAQLSSSARSTAAVTGSVLALAFAMRAVGDLAGDGPWHLLTWLSPLGWAQQVRPFHGDRFGVGLLAVTFMAAAVALAYGLRSRRDVGAGLVADRPGPAHSRMSSPLALAWRLQRGAMAGWSLGLLLGGALLGGLASNVKGFVDSPEAESMIRQLGGNAAIADAFLAAEFGILAVVVAGFGVAAALRLLGEETSDRAELTLSTATSRWTWLMSHVTLALVGSAWILLLLGLGGSAADAATTGSLTGSLGRIMPAALVQIPAVWVVVGVAVLLYGVSSRIALGSWAVLAGCLLLGQLADLLNLPDWVAEASPFSHVPHLPGGPVQALPLVVLLAVAAGAVLVGGSAFRRRDLS